jgi:competence protein ComEA
MAPRLALAAVALLALSAARLRAWLERPPPAPPCTVPEGRGVPPRHWLGCAGDPGPPRGLGGDERLVLGLPLDPNEATSRELACVPGFSRALGVEIVADRERRGPFGSVEELGRVRGIGPPRLATAASHLSVPRAVAAPRPVR